ncbi:MAG: DUF3566 domain-containing protein [bacterium]|nr:DUF3566 domain-containing protein [bacterium]
MKIIKKIAPLQLGKILAVLYGLISILFVPFLIIGVIFEENSNPAKIIFFIFIPILYIIGGFIVGIIGAAIYNLCAKFVGGIKITLEDEEIIQS